MLDFAAKYGRNVYSQFGEDGIIEEILKRIAPDEVMKICIEFGGHDGFFCSNTRNLINQGWNGKMYDLHENEFVTKKEITPENVNSLGTCAVLSIDCDGPDYDIWKAYTYNPALVIIEVNSSFPPPKEVTPGKDGASFTSMAKLGISKGYFLVCHTGNCVFLSNQYKHLFPEIISNPIIEPELYFNTSHL